MWTIGELKEKAKLAMKANYWKCVIAAIITNIITIGQVSTIGTSSFNKEGGGSAVDSAISTVSNQTGLSSGAIWAIVLSLVGFGLTIAIIISYIFTIFVKNPIIVGSNSFFVKNSVGDSSLGNVLDGFKNGHFINLFLVMLMRDIITFLWTFLFIIPGIVKVYQFRMVPYILAETPDISWKEALDKSKELMAGYKFKAFLLDLSFIGWHILSTITFGIVGIFYVEPYRLASCAEFYVALKDEFHGTSDLF